MNRCGIAALQAGLLLLSLSAGAAVRNGTIRIKVLDSETHSVALDDSGVPKNCDPTNYDAYCHSSKTATVTNTLLVQEDDQPPVRITCAVEAKWSRCVPLEKGVSFDARKEKRGMTVYYVDDNGKVRKQLYTLVESGAGSPAAAGTPAVPAQTAGAVNKQSVPAPTASASASQETVKCSVSSNPSGAEITLDGRYAGSTPSVLSVGVGAHVVEVSLPGFVRWKRDLTVSSGSELTVNAVLEKVQ